MRYFGLPSVLDLGSIWQLMCAPRERRHARSAMQSRFEARNALSGGALDGCDCDTNTVEIAAKRGVP